MMNGSESSLECFRLSGDGAFISRNALPYPTPRSIQKFSLGLHIRWLLAACFRLHISPLCKHGCVVFWVVYLSKDRVIFLISLQNSLMHCFQLKFPTLGESHWTSYWSQSELLPCVYSHRRIKRLIFKAWPALQIHPWDLWVLDRLRVYWSALFF